MSAYPPLSGLAPDLTAVRRLRAELDARGLTPLTGLTRKAWERLAEETGVTPVERHRTDTHRDHPAEPVDEEVWGPAWLGRLARLWTGPVPLHDLKPLVRRIAADPDLQQALLAEEALQRESAEADEHSSAILFELLGGYPALARAFGMNP